MRIVEEDVKFTLQLAQGIIDNSYFLEGKEAVLGQYRGKVLRVMGDDILVDVYDKNHPFKPGDKSKIYIEKKVIAIRDFEVIAGGNKSVALYVQEEMTTELVNSGHFNVVERLKLQSVLDELALSQSGAIDPKSVKQAGKLLGADVILTGTLAPTGDQWTTNLRLINTETGLIMAAFSKEGALHELKATAFRETKNIVGSFEDKYTDIAGWVLGDRLEHRAGKEGFRKVYIDDGQGAAGTNACLAMDFRLGIKRTGQFEKKAIAASIFNQLDRDLTGYSGIEFYIKGSENLTIKFQISDRQKDSSGIENWFRNIMISPEWKKVRIPFSSLSVQLGQAKKLGTNQILETDKIIIIGWVVHEYIFERGKEGTVWLDEVTFY